MINRVNSAPRRVDFKKLDFVSFDLIVGEVFNRREEKLNN